jgi:hypothetical protein
MTVRPLPVVSIQFRCSSARRTSEIHPRKKVVERCLAIPSAHDDQARTWTLREWG